MGNENTVVRASDQEVVFHPAQPADEAFRLTRTISDPSPTSHREDPFQTEDSLEPRMAAPARALTQPKDGWESSSIQRPLPPLPSDGMPRDPPSISRRPLGHTTRPPKPVRTSVAELERLLDDAESIAREKEEEIQRLIVDNTRLRDEWQHTSASLAATKATVTHVFEDKHFSSAWKQLSFSIRNWAKQHFGQRAPNSLKKWRKTQNPPEHMLELSPYWTEYMKSDDHRPLLVQAFVWNIIGKHVFANESKHLVDTNQYKSYRGESKQPKSHGAYWAYGEQEWLGKLNEDLKPAFETLSNPNFKPVVQSYFNWRISTVVFIQTRFAAYSGRNNNIPPLIKTIMKHLAPFAGSESSPPMTTPRVEQELASIIAEAIQLDSEMWRQKAFFHPGSLRVTANTKFDPNSMELWETPPEAYNNILPPVSLIISPCLIKTGNADGECYDISNVLVNSQVSGEFAYQVPQQHVPKSPTYQPNQLSRAQMPNQHVHHDKLHLNATVVERGPGEITPLVPRRATSTSRRSMDTHRVARSRDVYV